MIFTQTQTHEGESNVNFRYKSHQAIGWLCITYLLSVSKQFTHKVEKFVCLFIILLLFIRKNK